MIALGLDAGKNGGFCELDLSGPRPRWLRSGPLHEIAGHSYTEWLVELTGPDTLVVVETPVALHKPEANVHVVGTAVNAGELLASAANIRVLRGVLAISIAQVRASFIGVRVRGNQDANVKRALAALVLDMPRRTAVWERDAAAAAIVGARVWQRRPR